MKKHTFNISVSVNQQFPLFVMICHNFMEELFAHVIFQFFFNLYFLEDCDSVNNELILDIDELI